MRDWKPQGILLWIALITAALVKTGLCQSGTANQAAKFQEEAGQIYTTIFHKYNDRVRPPDFYPNPVPVNVSATLIHIRSLDVYKQELECIIDLEIKWQDRRLAWYANKVYAISVGLSKVWSPPIVYLNGAAPPKLLFDSTVIISTEGLITWNRREIVTTICPTDLQNVSQICELSLGFTGPKNREVFDNATTFNITPEFSSHEWDVRVVEVYPEAYREIRFILEMTRINIAPADKEEINCPSDIVHEVKVNSSRASSSVAGVQNWLVVLVGLLQHRMFVACRLPRA